MIKKNTILTKKHEITRVNLHNENALQCQPQTLCNSL